MQFIKKTKNFWIVVFSIHPEVFYYLKIDTYIMRRLQFLICNGVIKIRNVEIGKVIEILYAENY